jgi:hypothetical protein
MVVSTIASNKINVSQQLHFLSKNYKQERSSNKQVKKESSCTTPGEGSILEESVQKGQTRKQSPLWNSRS